MEGLFEIFKQNGFRQPQNPLPVPRMKDSFQNYVSTRREKDWHQCLKNR